MKGEPGAPPGPGGLAAPGGGEAGAQGEGWARLPERTYCPGPGARAPPGPPGPTRRRHLSPAAGSAHLLRRAKAHGADHLPPPRPASVSCPGPPAPGGAPRRNFAGRRRASGREGRSRELGGSRGRPQRGARGRSPRPAPGTATAYVGKALRPAGPCARADAVSSPGTDWSAPQAWRPPALAAQAARSGRPPGKCGGSAARPAAATSERARARVRRAPGACQGSLGGLPQPQRTPTRYFGLWICGHWERLAGGEGRRARVRRGQASPPAFAPDQDSVARLLAGWQGALVEERTSSGSSQVRRKYTIASQGSL